MFHRGLLQSPWPNLRMCSEKTWRKTDEQITFVSVLVFEIAALSFR